MRNALKILAKKPEGSTPFRRVGIKDKITSKWILKVLNARGRTEFQWFRVKQ